MLGERIGESTGKVTSQRVLPNPGGGPRIETSIQETGSLLGVKDTETATYIAVARPDGSLFGEGQGIVMSQEGDMATWVGQGVGTIKKDGSISYRGATYVQTTSPKWARLNSVAVLFEFEVDAQGNTRAQLYEWK
ncbi:MAG: hypothetical protein E6H58_07350 [Betaproteobacteria bacterium]|nr:MAG: hypothetical protein E6H65_00180 [Betaproteobacteria bacterium]TMH33987.1 MAG: hypothetical protein E6H58_07350 [Betaproteobacteria bacterium]